MSAASTATATTPITTPARSPLHVTEWPSIPGRLPLTEASVRRTVATADPAVRNLWITQSYADLARRLLDVLRTDQTWCTFAIWASFTAGRSIRGEELPHVVIRVLPDVDDHLDAVLRIAHERTSWLRRFGLAERLDRSHLERLVARAVEQVSASIADGNTLVFGELAPIFVRFVEGIDRDGAPAERDVEGWLDAHDVAAGAAEPLVRFAFRHYALAATATDARDRAQHVLAANVAAVLHEQERLQTDIVAALDAGLLDLGDDLAGTVHRFVPARIRERIANEVSAHAAAHLEHVWQHVATRLLMTLTTPLAVLHLGDDVPPRPDGTMFPGDLARLDLPELAQLLSQWDMTRGTGIGSGARDWADLRQRMTYIVNLFRSRQQALDLTVPPFTTGQLAWMVRGEVPPDL
jgi:hypothetical protein